MINWEELVEEGRLEKISKATIEKNLSSEVKPVFRQYYNYKLSFYSQLEEGMVFELQASLLCDKLLNSEFTGS